MDLLIISRYESILSMTANAISNTKLRQDKTHSCFTS